ncbi:ABC transporter substrate-binding protein [Leucobacter chromiiresistens]|uniref:ABC transporter substrate-binding protein n=1 Tax=Leucobacter chromiiresistens TaxID=1079994 RepID=A0A147ER53_9MICO|nr:ABC transporter substrate-binding protein [Leucobacter chromiiresistens]KTR86900.1 ABC transporter substrate-binding protein [Leucobacter chromiiresistens]
MKVHSKTSVGVLALVASAALVLSGCSSSGESEPTESGGDGGGGSSEALQIATLLPQTGSLGFLMPPVQAGIAQALADINGAGGVLGQDVEVVAEANEGDASDLTVVESGADDVIASGASFVLGAMGSGRSQHVVDRIAEAGILMGSPSNTSADLSGISPNYFRTAPPDTVQGDALGNQIVSDGVTSVAFLTFNDPYGLGLRDVIQETVEAAGAEVVYGGKGDGNEFPVEQTSFASEITAAKDSGAEAIVVVTYDQFKQIVPEAVNQGLDLSTFYLVDGNANGYESDFEAGTLEGAQASIPGAQSNEEFQQQLQDIYAAEYDGELESFTYAPEAYDLVTLVALAAEKAESTDSAAIQENLAAVSGADGGEECSTFEECAKLIQDGSDIQYVGKAGTGPLNENNDPSSAFIGIYQYDDANNPVFQKAVEGETE